MFQLCELSVVFFSLVRVAFAANVDLCSVLRLNLLYSFKVSLLYWVIRLARSCFVMSFAVHFTRIYVLVFHKQIGY